jgi:hypothetical protein
MFQYATSFRQNLNGKWDVTDIDSSKMFSNSGFDPSYYPTGYSGPS